MPLKHEPTTSALMNNKSKWGWLLMSTGLTASMALNFTSSPSLTDTKGGKSVTFSRASLATMYDSSGYLTYCPNNTITYSNDFGHATWGKAGGCTVTSDDITGPDGITPADKLTQGTGTGSQHGVYKTGLPVIPGGIASVYLKAGSASKIHFVVYSNATYNYARVDLSAGTITHGSGTDLGWQITSVGNGWYRVWGKFSGNGADNIFILFADGSWAEYFNGDGVSTVYVANVQAEVVTYETAARTYNPTTSAAYYGPRFDHYPTTGAARGLLVEEARTNIATNSNTFSTGANVTLTSSYGTGPDNVSGSTTRVVGNGLSSVHRVTCAAPGASSFTAYTFSIFVKINTGRYIQLLNEGNSQWYANFDLQSGVVGTKGTATTQSTIVNLGNGWFRLSATWNNSGTVHTNNYLYLQNSASAGYAAVAVNSDDIEIFGKQQEAGVFATSYIPAAASSVARVADSAKMTGTNFSDWFNAVAGVFVVGFEAPFLGVAGAGGYSPVFTVSDNTVNDRIALFRNTATTNWSPHIADGGVEQFAPTELTFTAYKVEQFAIGYELNNVRAAFNGTNGALDTSATMPTVDQLQIGMQVTTVFFNGWIRSISYYDTRLEDTDLEALTA